MIGQFFDTMIVFDYKNERYDTTLTMIVASNNIFLHGNVFGTYLSKLTCKLRDEKLGHVKCYKAFIRKNNDLVNIQSFTGNSINGMK